MSEHGDDYSSGRDDFSSDIESGDNEDYDFGLTEKNIGSVDDKDFDFNINEIDGFNDAPILPGLEDNDITITPEVKENGESDVNPEDAENEKSTATLDKIESNAPQDNPPDNKHSFHDWLNPENYKDGKYIGDGKDWGYKPKVNGAEVDTSEYREYLEQSNAKKDAVTQYMSEHNYGRWNFAEYSQDAQWRMLMADAYPDYELPPISKENASENMTRYYHERNLGSDDFAEYSKDPLWQRMYKDLYGEDFVPEEDDIPEEPDNTEETDESFELQGLENVPAKDINGFDPTEDSFWDYKSTDKETYMQLAEKLPEIQAELESGKTIKELSQNPEFADCINAYYNPHNIIKVEKHDDGLILQDDGRHRVAAAQELGNEVPVEVIDFTKQNEINEESQENENESFRSKLSSFFSDFFSKPENTEPIEEESEEPTPENIENEENQEDDEELEETEKSVVETIQNMNPEALSENDKEVIYNNSKDYILEKYGDYVPPERLDNLKDDVVLENTQECKKVYEQYGGDYEDEYVVGFYAADTGKIYVDVPRNGDMTNVMATVEHEALHKASMNEETGDNGLFTDNLYGLSREESRNINEGFTEMYAIRDMKDMGFEYESDSYVNEVYVAKQLEDIMGKDIAAEAYFTNNPELLRAEFEKSYATKEELENLEDGETIENGKYSEFLLLFNEFITNNTPENKKEVDDFLDDLRRRREKNER